MHIQQPLEIPSFKHLPTEDGRRAARRLGVAAFGEPLGPVFTTFDWVSREALKTIEDHLAVSKLINRQYDSGFQAWQHR